MPRTVNDGPNAEEPLTDSCPHSRSRRGRRVSYRRLLPSALPAVSALLLLAVTAIPAWASASPANGTKKWNRPVCGAGYVPVDLGDGNYFNVINSAMHNTCVTVERNHLSWYVSSWHRAAHEWQYPNISSGIEWGRYTCNDGASGYPSSPGSKCMRYPVRIDRDGEPVSSATVHPHIVFGNVSYDIWINRKNISPTRLRQPDGAEVMIWLSYPGIADQANARHVVIDGIAWDVMTWIASNAKTGTSWRYLAYLAHQQRDSVSRLWLNPFFRDAERAGEISPSWYLTAIDFGAEINQTVPGAGFDVAHYSLTGVR